MRFRILGPVRVRDGGSWLPVSAGRLRLLLATLLINAGQVLSTQRLAYELWGDEQPPGGVKTVNAYVMRLRRLLGDDGARLLVTRDRGYELAIGDGDLDAWEFERLAVNGNRELAAGRPGDALAHLTEALALWHGPILADVPDRPAWSARGTQLNHARLGALEDRMAALLELGRHTEAVNELHRLVEEHPLRESLWAMLMRAQGGCGRRADALETYQRARRVLSDELGIEPSEALRRIQREILAEDRSRVDQPAERPAVRPAQLPADVAGFTGRKGYVQQLDMLMDAGRGEARTVVISAINGAGGVGKTALAVHWAHRVAGQYPDGQLYVNLHGWSENPPVRPLEALAWFLGALGVPADRVPSTVEEASALYRSLLSGKRMLVLLDNARDTDQVRPLLPSSAGCAAVVTSRDRLGGLVALDGAVCVTVGVLAEDEAYELLTRLLGRERVRAEAQAVAELAEQCGHLPLALRIAAANLVIRPHTSIAAYVDRLRGDRLGGLTVDGDPNVGVKATFDLSYAGLPDQSQRLFRLMGLVPGHDATPPAVAALSGIDLATTRRLLDRLAAAHLVEEHQPGRYAMHDLIREYANQQSAAEDSAADRGAALDGLYGPGGPIQWQSGPGVPPAGTAR